MAYRPSQDRERDVERAHQLKAEGLSISKIALAMGIAHQTASNYINYPDGRVLYRKRKRQWAMCPGCGGKMSYTANQCMRCRRA